jgi:hypothetical protein
MITSEVNEILNKVLDGYLISREEIVFLLRIEPHSMEGGFIMTAANSVTRAASKGKAEVHAQIGLIYHPAQTTVLSVPLRLKMGFSRTRRKFRLKWLSNRLSEPKLMGPMPSFS